jgi:Double-GTPase 2
MIIFIGVFWLLGVIATAVAGFVLGVVVAAVWALRCFVVPFVKVGLSGFDGLAKQPDTATAPGDARGPGVPDYLHRVVFDDIALVRANTIARLREGRNTWRFWWEEIAATGMHSSEEGTEWFVVFISGFAVGAVAGVAVGGVAVTTAVAVQLIVAGVLSGMWRAFGLALRGLDSALLRVRNVRMFCVRCFRLMPYPAYHCMRCDATHWDIRAGNLGILWRTCTCGQRLPTLLLLGAASLDAQCCIPHCAAELPHDPGTARTVVLPAFGATNAGKTRLMYALVFALQRRAESAGIPLEYGDAQSEALLSGVRDMLGPSSTIEPTRISLENGLVLRLRPRPRAPFLLHLFDIAGERFSSRDRSEEHDYVRGGRDFVMVIDPLSLPDVWNTLPAEEQKRLGERAPRASVPSPDDVFHQAVDGILQVGGNLKRARLAIVISRADQIELPVNDELEVWAEVVGLKNLLSVARDTFRKGVWMFGTASVVENGEVHPSIDSLLAFLLPGVVAGSRLTECRVDEGMLR